MKIVTALEAKTRFGEVLEVAQRQPVSITRNGRPSVVMISAESYARRQRMARERLRQAMRRAGEHASAQGMNEDVLDQLLADEAERLVIDSNVWIAALISPTGTARQLVDAVLDLGIDILMSEATFAELVSRLDKPKFDRYREPEAWDLFLSELVELALWHEDAGTSTGVSRDPDDDKFLALAVTGQADAIISGDSDLLELVSHEGIPVLSPSRFLQRLREPEP